MLAAMRFLFFSPDSMGLLDPATSDGRVIFFLPWAGLTIAGTTDSPTEVTHQPAPREQDIQFILKEIKNYLSPEVHGSMVFNLLQSSCCLSRPSCFAAVL